MQPGNLSIVLNPDVYLTWDRSEGVYVDGYNVLRDGVKIAEVTGTSYTDLDVMGGGTYYEYQVMGFNKFGGLSIPSAVVGIVLPL